MGVSVKIILISVYTDRETAERGLCCLIPLWYKRDGYIHSSPPTVGHVPLNPALFLLSEILDVTLHINM